MGAAVSTCSATSSLSLWLPWLLASLLTMGKRQAAVPLTPGNVPGLVPGSEAARQWWTNQLLWAQQQAHHVGKREAVEVPAGVSAAFCPNYPFCTIVPAGYVNTAGYPAGVSAAACPGYPYC